ncbi:NAD(P)-binding protein [Thelephora ganbajun]|uniref:NAD(P)-binding protein n=1 Tax=Thelephora ganbajun TaxID=370292 RepID=A0ACB6ZXQ3_THEGA|nr:NAD(P)-binding protein [Thelephora ganbajun]
MSSDQPFVLRWGIISTGAIAAKFVSDVLIDPRTRAVGDVVHKVAVIGSRDAAKAKEFVNKFGRGDRSIKAYGTYEEVYADKDVDAVYIGTPHTHHYQNSKDAILAKKHVLCEKPVTSNATELKSLMSLAKENGVFFMEAMWTRFQPLACAFKRVLEDGRLGPPVSLRADLSDDLDIENLPTSHRILDPKLGGGALLDLGPYPMVWAIMTMYEHPDNKGEEPGHIAASMLKTPITGVDATTTFVLTFNRTLKAQAILSCSITLPKTRPGANIRFRNGNIIIDAPIYKPGAFTVEYFDKLGSGNVETSETKEFSYIGGGWHFQADEVARCIRDGKLESSEWGHDKSLLEMKVFDEVRRQGGYKFPDGVEQVLG